MSEEQRRGGLSGEKVDAVVTWVDGSDPAHAEKRLRALRGEKAPVWSRIQAGADPTRFENNDEVVYCLHSIRRYAPWVARIFLVTDGQCPKFLTPAEQLRLGVKLVDHRQIFGEYSHHLPTFNSLSIETVLHRIPGISRRFIYLNDDFILVGPTTQEDFFQEDRVVLRGQWQKIPWLSPARLAASQVANRVAKRMLGINRAMAALQQIRGAELAGCSREFFKVAHAPYPVDRETVAAFFAGNVSALERNISHKFRNLSQYALTSLANHLEIANGRADLCDSADSLMICFNRDSDKKIEEKLAMLGSNSVRFFCVQSLEQAQPGWRRKLEDLLDRRVLSPDRAK